MISILKRFFSNEKKNGREPIDEESPVTERDTKGLELENLIEKYGIANYPEIVEKQGYGIPYETIQTKEDLRHFWSLDVMAYQITWPGAQGAPGQILIATNPRSFFQSSYVWGELKYEDFRAILPELPEHFEDLHPWDSQEVNINGWYWYGIHSGCWLRVHESIWRRFFTSAEYFTDTAWIRDTWSVYVLEGLFYRNKELEQLVSYPSTIETIYEYSIEEAHQIEKEGIVAWRESDQGWCGMLCKNGKCYYRCLDSSFNPDLPIREREKIRNNTLPGWICYYCGLGHRVMIREEYNIPFRQRTYGMGKNADLWNTAFDVLSSIIHE